MNNKKDIIEMARKAGFPYDKYATSGIWVQDTEITKMLERFAELRAAAEREACVEKAGEFARKWWSIHCDSNKHMETTRKAHDDFCALQAAIRARGNT